MEEPIVPTIEQHFGDMTDPRVDRTKLHDLLNILVIAICAIIGGADNWEDVEEFGKARLAWFQTFLDLPNGIPSHDTFTRVFARLNPEEFRACFLGWIGAVSGVLGAQVIAIDGKVLRRSHDKGIGRGAIDMVSAWATANRLVLGQVKVDEKSNEITAIPQLLQSLAVAGCIVTIDAMGGHPGIAAQIVDRDGEYVLALKKTRSISTRMWCSFLTIYRPATIRRMPLSMRKRSIRGMDALKSVSAGPFPTRRCCGTYAALPTGRS